MPNTGQHFYERDGRRLHRWTVQAVKPPKDRTPGYVHLRDKFNAALMIPWPAGVEDLEKTESWRWRFNGAIKERVRT